MAIVLQIVSSGLTTVDMDTDDTSWRMLRYWEPVVASPPGDGSIPPPVTDVLPVIIKPSNDNDFALEQQYLFALMMRAAEYAEDDDQENEVWFHRQMPNETGTERSLVYKIEWSSDARFGSWYDTCPQISEGRLARLAITHHACWEKTTAIAASGTDNVSVLGGAVDYTDVVGDFPARPYYIHVDDSTETHQYAYLGFRSDARTGSTNDAAKFTALWELEGGTGDTDTAATTDATASPGGGGNTKMRCDFSSETGWDNRVSLPLNIIEATAGDLEAYRGTFLVLLRAKIDSGVAQVKLQQRGIGAQTTAFGPVVDVSSTSWTIHNLGTVKLPMRDRKAFPIALFAATYDDDDYLIVWARVKSGSPAALDMDCLVLLPIDEYFVALGNTSITSAAGAYCAIDPMDRAHGISINSIPSSHIQDVCPVSVYGPGVPVGDGRIFICMANASYAAPAFDANVDVELSYYPRWLAGSGAENS